MNNDVVYQLLVVAVLFFSFTIGQLLHIAKTNSLDNKKQLKVWYHENLITFWTQVILGMSVLQVIMSQLDLPVNLFGWVAYFYAGLNAGIAGNSVGQTVNKEIVKVKGKGVGNGVQK